jgi:hypothetical protein
MKNIIFIIVAILILSCNENRPKKTPIVKPKEHEISKSDVAKSIPIPIVEEPTNRFEQVFGQFKDFQFYYDCIDCTTSYSGTLLVYIKNQNFKKELFNIDIEGFYLNEIKLLNIKNNYFIYVLTDHTYGHRQGYLYYLNTQKMITVPVKIIPNYKKDKTDTLHIHKYMNLITDDYKTFKNGYTYFERQDKGDGDALYLEYKMILKRKDKNSFVLLCN